MAGDHGGHGGHEAKTHSSGGGDFNMLKPLGVEEITTGLYNDIIAPAAEIPMKVAESIEKFTPGLDGGGHGGSGHGEHH